VSKSQEKDKNEQKLENMVGCETYLFSSFSVAHTFLMGKVSLHVSLQA
jgi:hypothetical protein